MTVLGKIVLLSFLATLTLFVQTASATLISLPDSSYAEAEGNWQGNSIYTEGDFYVHVDFTVYDTYNLVDGSDEELWFEGMGLSDQGQYLYAYQIFNAYGEYEDVGYFGIFGAYGVVLDEAAMLDIGSQKDSDDPTEEGVEPTSSYFDNDDSRVVWEFANGLLVAGDEPEHSWFLLLFSNFEPVPGGYEIKAPEGDFPAPGIPEPATITLLGLGNVLLIINRRRFLKNK